MDTAETWRDFMPTHFWENVRAELETIKPVFMLAE